MVGDYARLVPRSGRLIDVWHLRRGGARRPARSGAVRPSIGPMTATLHHRGPDGQGVFSDDGARRSATGGWRSSIAPAARSRCRTRTARAGSSSTARSTTIARCAAGCSTLGHTLPHPLRHRGDPPRLRGVRRRLRRDARRHVRVRDLRRAAARAVRSRAIGSARSRSSTRSSAARCTSPARSRRCARARRGIRRSICRRSRATCRSATSSRRATIYRHVRKLPARPLAARCATAASRCGRYWDVERFDDHRRRRGGARGADRRHAARRGARSPRERGAARRVPVRRHRLRPGRVVHGRGARPRRDDDHRSGSARRRTTSSRPPASTAAHFETQHHVEIVEPRARRRARSHRRRLRRAVRRLVGDSDLLRRRHGAAARHGRAQRRRRRRERSAATASATCRTRSKRWRAALLPGDAGTGGGGVARAALAAIARLPRAFRVGTLLENICARSGGRLLRRPVRPEAARRRGSCSAWRRTAIRGASVVYEAVTEPYRRCPSTSAVQRAQYADLKIYLPNDVW